MLWVWHTSNVAWCFIRVREANMPAGFPTTPVMLPNTAKYEPKGVTVGITPRWRGCCAVTSLKGCQWQDMGQHVKPSRISASIWWKITIGSVHINTMRGGRLRRQRKSLIYCPGMVVHYTQALNDNRTLLLMGPVFPGITVIAPSVLVVDIVSINHTASNQWDLPQL